MLLAGQYHTNNILSKYFNQQYHILATQPDTDLIFITRRRENTNIGAIISDYMCVVAKEDAEYRRYLYSEGSAV